MSILEHLSTDENTRVSSEEILNVLRRSDDLVTGTSDIADTIGMSVDGARDRLRSLEEDERVISQKIGNKNGYTLVWGLHPSERQEPIVPEIDRLVKWCDAISHIGWSIIRTGVVAFAIGTLLWFISISLTLGGWSLGILTNAQLHVYGYGIAGGGTSALLFGSAVVIFTIVAETIAEFRVNRTVQ
ncbi:hypothetical protein ACFQMM_13685 [Saliphagus sp. GCM10025308]